MASLAFANLLPSFYGRMTQTTPRPWTLAQARLVLQVPVATVPEPQHGWPRAPHAMHIAGPGPGSMQAKPVLHVAAPPPAAGQQSSPEPPHAAHIMAPPSAPAAHAPPG